MPKHANRCNKAYINKLFTCFQFPVFVKSMCSNAFEIMNLWTQRGSAYACNFMITASNFIWPIRNKICARTLNKPLHAFSQQHLCIFAQPWKIEEENERENEMTRTWSISERFVISYEQDSNRDRYHCNYH